MEFIWLSFIMGSQPTTRNEFRETSIDHHFGVPQSRKASRQREWHSEAIRQADRRVADDARADPSWEKVILAIVCCSLCFLIPRIGKAAALNVDARRL